LIFNSIDFIIFFCIVIPVYFALKQNQKRYFILFASYFFYGWWNPYYLVLIFASSFIDYYASRKIFSADSLKKEKFWLITSVLVNIGILFTFKYANFFAHLLSITSKDNTFINVLLPVGISFYTFQTMSYTIDVFRKKIKPEKSIVNFALYVAFFPQLVAGPIERAEKIIPQLKQNNAFDNERIAKGLFLMIVGFFQKVVIADNLAVFVDIVYNNPENYKGLSIAIATLFFAFQIYNDFAGYTNIARGVALMMGINLSVNFKQPYLADSIKNFWQRWHITLSSWFRDYVYISMGGNKNKSFKWIFVIIITFSLSGLWHGAKLTFIVWGVLNAFLYLLEHFIEKYLKIKNKNKVVKLFRVIFTFILINFLWIFFRADSLQDSTIILKNLFVFDFSLPFDRKWMLICFLLISLNIIFDVFEYKKMEFQEWIFKQRDVVLISITYLLMLFIFFIGNWHLTPFIYFQF